MLSFAQALNLVKDKVAAAARERGREVVPLEEARGRILADEVLADRDYPPFHRSLRDGYAVRAADVAAPPVELLLRGEVRAGAPFTGSTGAGECVAIMTGAPLPAGADAVMMLEYTESRGERITIRRAVHAGDNVVGQGSETRAGARVLPAGRRLGGAELGLLGAVGKSQVPVYARPEVAILSTGDEVVPVEHKPEWFQIRNSNAIALAAQVAAAGGVPHGLGIAPDHPEALRGLIQQGLQADLLVLTGGVSVGKYDFVEAVLTDLGAEFYFHSVALRPGKPVVFGHAAGKFFFGLPGNPISALITFALFVRPTLALMGGAAFEPPLFVRARALESLEQKTDLTVLLPARLERHAQEPWVRLVKWQGSGDLVAAAAADCFLVLHQDQTGVAEGDWVDVMPKEQW